MKRREAMLKARGISVTVLTVVSQQGKDRETFELNKAQLAEISSAALDVATYLCVPQSE